MKKQFYAYLHTHWDLEWYRDIFEFNIRFLDVFDISVDNIISKKIYELNREELFYIRLYYWLGKKIEKYFIIPFSQYLNIFMPFYQKRYNINLSLKEYFYNEHFKNESTLEYTSSCGFQLTEFGKEILDINAEDEFKKLDYDVINKLASLYNSTNVKLLAKYMRRNENE